MATQKTAKKTTSTKRTPKTKPKAAKSSDKIYKWTWDNLKSLIHGVR